MEKRIFIIHRSAIVRYGLKAIIEKITDYSIIDLEVITPGVKLKISKSILLIESALLVDIQPKQLQIFRNSPIITICDNLVENSIKTINNCCSLNASEYDIHALIKPLLTIKSTTASYNKSENLTSREIEVLKQIALGNSNKEIADMLFISLHTVISHRKNITQKLGIKSISGLAVYAFMNKIIDHNTIETNKLL